MSDRIEGPELERFRAAIVRRLGLQFDEGRTSVLQDVLRRRVAASGLSLDAYLRALESDGASEEWAFLVPDLTVAETYFFRNVEQFRAVAELAVPETMRRRRAVKQLRVLSAGCASGEEAYSLAMLLRETVVDPTWDVSILGIDLNAASLERAARARFSGWALRETPIDVKERWFRVEGGELALADSVRKAVRFERRNLTEDDAAFWRPEAFDVVFCRNVLMYFAPEPLRAIVARIAASLVPGGYLFLGHAETLRGVSDDFHLRHTHGTFYYQRKERLGATRVPRPGSARAPLEAVEPRSFEMRGVPGASCEGNDWPSAIRRASERIESLAQEGAAPRRAPSRAVASRAVVAGSVTRPELVEPLELLRLERFADALGRVEAMAPMDAGAAADPELLLLLAVLLTHNGELSRAQATCERLLALDELDAGAHYVLALCRQDAGDEDGACEHSRTAVHLDPSFAMPRLHLGLLARRRGQWVAARSHLESAVALLRRETPERMTLFGGGFGRDAWMTLCRAELAVCGGRP